jgi:hypothetical protein
MPAGDYYVGDLCYVMHDCWDEVISIMFDDDEDGRGRHGEFVLKDGRRFAVYGTAYGDGVYHDEQLNEYSVDAGLIGCILVSKINEEEQKNLGLGIVHTFPRDFKTGYADSRYGVIDFGGRVIIDTVGYDMEDDDEDL